MTDRYAVIGHPVSHSISPRIHAEFAQQTGHDISYEAILAPLDAFAVTVERFHDDGGKGVNITLPFKHEAYEYADHHSARAEHAQAVNVLTLNDDGTTSGDNTDGIGLVRDIEHNLSYTIVANRVLLLGAGGAARGVLEPLLAAKPVNVVIANRTVEKAEALAEHFARFGACSACSYDELKNRQFDLVINATSASLNDEMPALPATLFAPRSLAYDMVYSKAIGKEPPFLAYARAHGAAQVADGLGMLVEQAAESFLIWRGVRPDTAPVLKNLRGS